MGKQEFIAVRCFSCKNFQVIIASKKSKFQCKICHENQSVQKVYAISNQAKDIRMVVQTLNMNISTKDADDDGIDDLTNGNQQQTLINENNIHLNLRNLENLFGTRNKWSQNYKNDNDVEN